MVEYRTAVGYGIQWWYVATKNAWFYARAPRATKRHAHQGNGGKVIIRQVMRGSKKLAGGENKGEPQESIFIESTNTTYTKMTHGKKAAARAEQ